MKKLNFIIFVLITIINLSAQIKLNGEEVINEMYKKWNGKWYKNFSFQQEAIYFKDGKETKKEIWQEILSSPGNLHIRFNGFETGDGIVFTADSSFTFSKGKITKAVKQIHQLLILGFDVYFLEPTKTINYLKELKFDLTKFCTRKWNEREVFVVGTNDISDSKSNQFWIDKEHLYLIKSILNTNGVTRDIEFAGYKLFEGKYPVATEIIFKNNDSTVLVEKYFDIKFHNSVEKSIFDINKFQMARW